MRPEPLEGAARFVQGIRPVSSNTRFRSYDSMRSRHRPSVLIVDDDAHVLRSVIRSLKMWEEDWVVRAARSGPDALESLARDGAVDVLLADLRMPGMDGLELAAKVKEQYPDVVRVAHTGAHDLLERTRGSGLFDSVLVKPAKADQIKMVLLSALQRRRMLREAEEKDSSPGVG